ncbi:MAG: hypothetical protein P4M12_07730 [Gammaproteobacteria bacterium]|nr:hypothetical protein [Gammaproteobacteria bacterium]
MSKFSEYLKSLKFLPEWESSGGMTLPPLQKLRETAANRNLSGAGILTRIFDDLSVPYLDPEELHNAIVEFSQLIKSLKPQVSNDDRPTLDTNSKILLDAWLRKMLEQGHKELFTKNNELIPELKDFFGFSKTEPIDNTMKQHLLVAYVALILQEVYREIDEQHKQEHGEDTYSVPALFQEDVFLAFTLELNKAKSELAKECIRAHAPVFLAKLFQPKPISVPEKNNAENNIPRSPGSGKRGA